MDYYFQIYSNAFIYSLGGLFAIFAIFVIIRIVFKFVKVSLNG